MSIIKADLEWMILDKSTEPNDIPLSVLAEITNGFSDELEIGRGGYAKVYKGILKNGYVAVKRLVNTYMYEKEFYREVECLIKVKHRNIVRFLGYCADTQWNVENYEGKFVMANNIQERLLCFEYVPNGSLYDYIKDASCGLEWRIRYRIIKDICEGLLYLHQEKICHLDLKPGNILLDRNMVAKITGFGISRCFGEDESKIIATNVCGTIGYLAPEFSSKVVTHKFDLYSLGCIIMEMLTGNKGYQDTEKVLERCSNMLGISQDNPIWEQIKVCAEIAMECIDCNPEKRPDCMKDIMYRLVQIECAEAETEGDDVEAEGGEVQTFFWRCQDLAQSSSSESLRQREPAMKCDEAGKRHPAPSTSAGDAVIELRPSLDVVIPKVPPYLSDVAGELFRPHLVPIGPYHRVAGSKQWTQEKKRVVQDLERCGLDISYMIKMLDGVQSRARASYTHLPDDVMDSDMFCSMLLLDGCYLLSLFLEFKSDSTGSYSSDMRPTLSADNTVMRDVLYLIENQIPMFVIDKIFNFLAAQGEERSAVMCMATHVQWLLQKQLYISKTVREAPSTSYHLLSLVYSFLAATEPIREAPSMSSHETAGLPMGRWRRASEYRRYANIWFKARSFDADEEWTILEVQLVGGSLSIPPLRVDNYTFTLLRNLMALEEHKDAKPVTAYCIFMSHLARTAEDVELLRNARVIEHFMASNELAAQGFAVLCEGAMLDIDRWDWNYLKPLWHDLEKRCSVRWNNFMGLFR